MMHSMKELESNFNTFLSQAAKKMDFVEKCEIKIEIYCRKNLVIFYNLLLNRYPPVLVLFLLF